MRIFVGCLVGMRLVWPILLAAHKSIETLAFHFGVVIACATALKVLDITCIAKTNANASIPYPQSDIRSEFR